MDLLKVFLPNVIKKVGEQRVKLMIDFFQRKTTVIIKKAAYYQSNFRLILL